MLTSPDLVVGTPGLLSPEQAAGRGGTVGPAADVFSLACLLAYAATGRPPFGTGTVDVLLYRTVHDEPNLSGMDGADGELAGLLRDCLAKDPAARPEVADVAARLIEDVPLSPAEWLPDAVVQMIAERSAAVLALPEPVPTVAEPAAAPPGRRRLLLGAGAAVVLAGGGATAWALLRDEGGGRPATAAAPRAAIGLQADLSGPSKAVGLAQQRGATLAVEQYNARGDRPYPVALRVSDDRGDPSRAPVAARRLTEDRSVLATLGSTTDDTTFAVVGAYDEGLLPLLSVSAGLNLLTAAGNRSFLRGCPQEPEIGLRLAYRLQSDTTSVQPGLLEDRTAEAYAWQYVTIASVALREFGHRPYPRVLPAGASPAELAGVVADMVRAGIDAYVHLGPDTSAATAARELARLRFDGPRFAGQTALTQRFLDEAGDGAEGWLVLAPAVDASVLPAARGFASAHRKRFGAPPAPYAAEAYDAVNLFLAEMTAGAHGGRPPTRSALAARMRKSRYRGITKAFSFEGATGEFHGEGTFLHRVEDGAFRFLGQVTGTPPARRRA